MAMKQNGSSSSTLYNPSHHSSSLNKTLDWLHTSKIPNKTFGVYLVGLFEILSIIFWKLIASWTWESIDLPDQGIKSTKSRTIVITGAERGLGYAMARELIKQHNVNLILTYPPRVVSEGHDTTPPSIKYLQAKAGKDVTVECFPLDLSIPSSIEALAKFVSCQLRGQLCLINNAAVMEVPFNPSCTPGDPQILINYLGHLRLYLLLKSKKPKVINIASSAAFACSHIDYTSFDNPETYSPLGNYAQSKLAILMWTRDLIQDEIQAFAFHPSVLPTHLYDHNRLGMGYIFSLLRSTPLTSWILSLVMGTERQSALWCLELLDKKSTSQNWFQAYGESWQAPRRVNHPKSRKHLKSWSIEALKRWK